MLELNVYDVLKLDATPEQWEEIVAVVAAKLGGRKKPAPRKRDDDY